MAMPLEARTETLTSYSMLEEVSETIDGVRLGLDVATLGLSEGAAAIGVVGIIKIARGDTDGGVKMLRTAGKLFAGAQVLGEAFRVADFATNLINAKLYAAFPRSTTQPQTQT